MARPRPLPRVDICLRFATAAAVLLLGGCSSHEAARRDLPVAHQDSDEDGPTDVASAWQASDYVVLATIAGSTDGARFYGGDDAEEIGGSQWTEDIELQLTVSQYLRGSGQERLDIQWPTYLTAQPSSDTRTAVQEIEGVQRDLSPAGRYVFFLKDHGEPWGLTSVSLGASLMEVRPDLTVQGQVSSVFSDLRGQDLGGVLPESAPELDAG